MELRTSNTTGSAILAFTTTKHAFGYPQTGEIVEEIKVSRVETANALTLCIPLQAVIAVEVSSPNVLAIVTSRDRYSIEFSSEQDLGLYLHKSILNTAKMMLP